MKRTTRMPTRTRAIRAGVWLIALAIGALTACEKNATKDETPPEPSTKADVAGAVVADAATAAPAGDASEDVAPKTFATLFDASWSETAPPLDECPVGAMQEKRVLASGGGYDLGCYRQGGAIRHGRWSRWSGVTGKVSDIASFDKGEPHGQWTAWNVESGHKISEEHYQHGTLHGLKATWTDDGHLLRAGLHVGGQKHGRWLESFTDLEDALHFVGRCYRHGERTWEMKRPATPETLETVALDSGFFDKDCALEKPASVAVADPAPDTTRPAAVPLEPWAKGTRWVYRTVRNPVPGAVDEAGYLAYYYVREVAETTPIEGGLHVRIEERGGPDEDKVRNVEYEIKGACITPIEVPHSQKTKLCLEPENMELIQSPLGASSVDAVSMVAEKEGSSAWLAPSVGLWRTKGSDRRGRTITTELIGYAQGESTGGRHNLEPVVCDWNDSIKARGGKVSISLAGNQGFAAFDAADGTTSTGEPGATWVLNSSGFHTKTERTDDHPGFTLKAAKSWDAVDGHGEYVLIHLEREDLVRFVILRLVAGVLEEHVMEYPRPPKNAKGDGRFSSFLTALEGGCFMQLLWIEKDQTIVRNLLPGAEGIAFGEGTL